LPDFVKIAGYPRRLKNIQGGNYMMNDLKASQFENAYISAFPECMLEYYRLNMAE
jgi:hypothetical protein